MCGIAGFAGPGTGDSRLLEAMTETLVRRGPDARGTYLKGGVGLGSRRLAVIDLETGGQPMAGDGEDPCVVVFNGEIYNFAELRKGLEGRRRFRTRSDTEVIVRLYEEKGLEGLTELSGMYAFALWDPRERRLILARDPLGVKPLYYAQASGRLYFASEIKALLEVPEISRELDLESLAHYLDYLYVPSPRTIYASIRKLRPGERLVWKDGRAETGLFWSPPLGPRAPMSRGEALAELDRLLTLVVSQQRVSDVPLGLFLSGGLDSSALAAYLAQGSAPPEAFCADYGDPAFDELEKARAVARRFGLRLNALRVEPDVDGVLEGLVEAFDEPVADSSALPTAWVCREARRSVKVALTGIGGDEAFGGYPRYLGLRLRGPYGLLPAAVRRGLARASSGWGERVSSRNVGGWARRFLESGTRPLDEAYAAWMGHLSPSDRRALFGPALRSAGALEPAPLTALRSISESDPLRRVLAADLRTYLPEDLLTLADRSSMAHGLELRVPLCDQRLVEFALRLPSDLRVSGLTLKPLLKELLRKKLPPGIVDQKKQGFMVPVGEWLKGRLAPRLDQAVQGLARRGLVSAEGARALAAEHAAGRRNRSDVLWALLFLERWFERWQPGFRLAGRPPKAKGRRLLVVSDFIFPDEEGGAGRLGWETARRLKARGRDVRLWCLADPAKPPEETIDGLPVRRFGAAALRGGPAGWPAFVRAARRDLEALIAEFKPGDVLTHQPLSGALVQAAAPEDAAFLHFYHSSWPGEFRAERRPGAWGWPGTAARSCIERRVLGRARNVATLSRFMRDDLLSRYGLPASKVKVVPAGVDAERFKPGDKAEARRRLGLGPGPVLATVRNLRPRNGLELFLEAAAALRASHPGLTAVIAGAGPLESELKRRAAELGLGGAVRFDGRVADEALADYYRAADLFVMPTRELEGLGLVLLEALACGTPCVGTPVGGIPEVLAPIEPAWLAAEVSGSALAAAAERALSRAPSPDALRAHVLSRYSWDRCAEALEDLLDG